jgi:hypothetical protein
MDSVSRYMESLRTMPGGTGRVPAGRYPTPRLHSSPVLGSTPGDWRGLGGTPGDSHPPTCQTVSRLTRFPPTAYTTSPARFKSCPRYQILRARDSMSSGLFSFPWWFAQHADCPSFVRFRTQRWLLGAWCFAALPDHSICRLTDKCLPVRLRPKEPSVVCQHTLSAPWGRSGHASLPDRSYWANR